MNQKKFVIVGCQHGHIAMFIEEMHGLGYECAGIYERDPVPLASGIAESYGIPLYQENDYTQLNIWHDNTIEMIGSSAINHEKIDIVELCASHGKHAMLDKPAAVNREDYHRLEAVIRSGRIQVGMLLTERVNPALYTLRQLNAEGAFGHIVNMSFRKPHRLAASQRPDWFFDKSQNGGVIVDILIHDFDILCWITGQEIQSSSGYLGKRIMPEHETFYDTAHIQTVMEDGTVAQLYADWHTPDASWAWGDTRIFVTGTKASAELRLAGDPLLDKKALLLLVTNEATWSEVGLYEVPYTVCGDFVRRIRGEESAITHLDILVATKAAIDADEAAEKVVRL